MVLPYKAEAATDFTQESNKQAFKQALEQVKEDFGVHRPLVIGGKEIMTDDKTTVINPADKEQILGHVSKAKTDHIEQAFEAAEEAFESWSAWTAKERADLLLRISAIIRRRKHEFSALMVYEAGKPWNEADGDTNEAIDFIEYYARSMVELADGKPTLDREGETNSYFYQPMGVGVTISPWNFPFAIMAGTTLAPVVAGNTVLLKPSGDTPLIAYKLMEVLEEAGLPGGVVNFVPGSSRDIGDYMVDHHKTQFITFTGSKGVGLRITERAAVVQEGQHFLKRTITEMGGKDTIIVDKDADLDVAAESIVTSAFGFSGQKCSACSRAVVHEDVHDEVLARSIELAKELTVGNTVDNTDMGPVVSQKQFDNIKEYIETGKKEGKLEFGGETDDSTGFFVHPTIFSGLDPEAVIMQEEIFGPVVGFTKVKDFDEGLKVANNTEYGLTGAVITNTRENWHLAVRKFDVGNLYLNRGCTAAVVGYHPFGGFKLSGTDQKTGSPDYLLNFLNQKVASEMF